MLYRFGSTKIHNACVALPMDSIEPFVVLARYRLVVCQKCGFAVVAKEVFTHLRVRHPDVPVSRRKETAEAIAMLPDIIQDQAGLSDFLYPPPTTSYIPHVLPPQKDGLKCCQRQYIARQLQKFQAHCRTCHG